MNDENQKNITMSYEPANGDDESCLTVSESERLIGIMQGELADVIVNCFQNMRAEIADLQAGRVK